MPSLELWVAIIAILVGSLTLFKFIRSYVKIIWYKTLGRRKYLLNEILTELRPNGGTSIRDALNRIEERQTEFEASMNAQLNIHEIAVFRTDVNGKCIMTNRAYQRLTGFGVLEVLGDGWINVIDPSDRAGTFHKWTTAVKENREFSENIRHMSTTGEPYMVHVNGFREMDKTGKVRGYLGTCVRI